MVRPQEGQRLVTRADSAMCLLALCLHVLAEFPESSSQVFTLLEEKCLQELPYLYGTAQESHQLSAGEVSPVGSVSSGAS